MNFTKQNQTHTHRKQTNKEKGSEEQIYVLKTESRYGTSETNTANQLHIVLGLQGCSVVQHLPANTGNSRDWVQSLGQEYP